MRSMLLAAILCWTSASNAWAIDVEITGLHLCCGGCVSGVEDAINETTGVSQVQVDRESRSAKFVAPDEETAKKALASVAEAGFHGAATADKKELAFPNETIAEGTTVAKATFKGVHLCCRACTNGAKKSLADIDGLGTVTCDQKKGTVVVEAKAGEKVDLVKVQAALNKAGFHGAVAKE